MCRQRVNRQDIKCISTRRPDAGSIKYRLIVKDDLTPQMANQTNNPPSSPAEQAKLESRPRERVGTIKIIELVIPVATFILGCLFALFLQSATEGREARQRSVTEVVRLTRDWYHQIHTISVAQRGSGTRTEPVLDPVVYDYIHNRVILPELLFHLQILRGRGECQRLCTEVEEFLGEVTTFRPPRTRSSGSGDGAPVRCLELISMLGKSATTTEMLARLDSRIQDIVVEAAKLAR